MNAYMHEKKEREGKKLPQGGGPCGDRIGPSVAAQSKYYELSWNPHSMTFFLYKFLLSPN